VQQLLEHSTVTITMRCVHPNLDSKRNATAKLESFGESLVTPCTKTQQSKAEVSPIVQLKAFFLYLRNGGVVERLKPAVLKNEIAFRYLADNSTNSLCQPQDSDKFSFFNLLCFCSFCASFSADLATAERLNRWRS
jgi:hypothetical protein